MKNFYFDISNISLYRSELMGFAILWVILYHSGFAETFLFANYLSTFSWAGFGGVDIFMMLSGFGLTFSVCKKRNVKAFYISRIMRIYPIYFFLVIIGCLLNNSDNFFIVLWKCTALGYWTNGIYFDWYVPSILTLYALFPFIINILCKKKTYLLVIIGVFIVFAIIHVFFDFSFLDWQHFSLVYRIPIFLYGVILAYSIINEKKIKSYLFISIVLLFIGFFFNFTYRLFSYCISIAFATPFIVVVLCKLFSIANFNFFKVIGKASLEIYIVHVIILQNKCYLSIKDDSYNFSTFLLLFVSVISGILISKFFDYFKLKIEKVTLKKL